MKCIFLFFAFAIAALSRSAHADEGDASLAFRAPSTCPSRDALIAGVSGRTPQARFAEHATGGLDFRVGVTSAASRFRATVEIRRWAHGLGGQHETRVLRGATCAEVVDAAALVIALAIDPNASLSLPVAEPTPEPPLLHPPVQASSLQPPLIQPLQSYTLQTQPTEPRAESSSSSGLSSEVASRWAPFVSGSLATELGTLPHAALVAAVAFGVEQDHRLFAPSFALDSSLATSDLTPTSMPRGSYVRGLIRGEGCPLNVAPSALISIRPCAWIGVGVIRAEGTAAPIPRTDTSTWGDAGVRLRARLRRGRLFAELGIGLVIPLVRPRFVTASPRVVLYETPAAGALFALGAGVRF